MRRYRSERELIKLRHKEHLRARSRLAEATCALWSATFRRADSESRRREGAADVAVWFVIMKRFCGFRAGVSA